MSKLILKSYGINKTIFDEIFNAVVNYSFDLSNSIIYTTARREQFLAKCNNPVKVEKVLKKNNLVYLTNLRMEPTKHTFKCSYLNGDIKTFEIEKKKCKSIKDAFTLALVEFLN